MKPTPQVSSEQTYRKSFPLTDYQYQSAVEASLAGVKETHGAHPLRATWKLSAEFFGAEVARDFAIEFALFTLIAGLSAWPIISMLVAVVRMVRNY
jgi:hypothetical protein